MYEYEIVEYKDYKDNETKTKECEEFLIKYIDLQMKPFFATIRYNHKFCHEKWNDFIKNIYDQFIDKNDFRYCLHFLNYNFLTKVFDHYTEEICFHPDKIILGYRREYYSKIVVNFEI